MSSVITALLNGLRNQNFKASLSKKPPESMTELLRRCEEYIDQEEVMNATQYSRNEQERSSRKRRYEDSTVIKPSNKLSFDHRYRPKVKEMNVISRTELTAPLLIILRNQGKRKVEEVEEKRWVGVIHVIVGGSAAGKDSRNARKDYARSLQINLIKSSSRFSQPIKFDDKDLLGISFPHDDALVITGDIVDFDVKRVLVDTGRASNVLSWNTFKALKISIDRLKPVNTPLLGFGRATVIPEGIVDLIVVLGRHPTCVTLITLFLVVQTSMA
ncbi:Uncharacterized protein Adt_23227 [Abeliophyllum distichum]|uniref:Uncharacterized protein n=1 Tax=Abeliophyllum distichum TaxID=126358 RepID=A0ABD1SD93_9LAMI